MLSSGDILLRSENMAGWGDTFFRDGERNCYCILKGAEVSPELKKYLASVPAAAGKYPELKNDTDVDIKVYGGRFIAVDGMGFELDGKNITEYGGFAAPDKDSSLPVINVNIGQPKR